MNVPFLEKKIFLNPASVPYIYPTLKKTQSIQSTPIYPTIRAFLKLFTTISNRDIQPQY